MAGTTRSASDTPTGFAQTVRRFENEWTSDGSGDYTYQMPSLTGYLLKIETIPSATTPPTAYAVAIDTSDGLDLLGGAGAGRSATAKEQTMPSVGGDAMFAFFSDAPTISISGAGASNEGKIIVYVLSV